MSYDWQVGLESGGWAGVQAHSKEFSFVKNLGKEASTFSVTVAPKVWVVTQTRFTKGQKMGHTEVIQTLGVSFQLYHCLPVSVCSVGTWEKSRSLTMKTNLATYS